MMKRAATLAEQIVLPHVLRRYLTLLRTIVCIACAWIVLSSQIANRPLWLTAIAAVFVYSLGTGFFRLSFTPDLQALINFSLDSFLLAVSVYAGGPAAYGVAALAAFSLLLPVASIRTWREVLIATIIAAVIVYLVAHPSFGPNILPFVGLLGLFGCVTALMRRTLFELLARARHSSFLYRADARRIAQLERDRIAADLHDGPVQVFMGLQMRLEVLRRLLEKRDEQRAMDELHRIQELTQRHGLEFRTFVRNMRPPYTEGPGLAAAIRSAINTFQQDTGIAAEFVPDPSASHEDMDAPTDVIQIVREALNNVQKHSSASRVRLDLACEQDAIHLQITDDGKGFPFDGTYSLSQLDEMGIGPESIKRRLRHLHGQMTLTSSKGHGSVLSILVPPNPSR